MNNISESSNQIRLFIDFGSTFTKVCAFDIAAEALVGWAKAPSTVDTDITIGLKNALELLEDQITVTKEMISKAYASSSAAGGLRIACIGLTPELTTKAARIAAFGAGAKIVGTYSYVLTEENIRELEQLSPDIVILSGGTDGGDKKNIIKNAELLAASASTVDNIIVAGNKAAYDDIYDIFSVTDKNVSFSKNILPSFGKLDIDHINVQIRDAFIKHITISKGIDNACKMIGKVICPTPSAVLEAAKLLADGVEDEEGLGELMIVDVGGATTDVYSVANGYPTISGVNPIGLQEPRVKRTVEGDLGLFHNLDRLADENTIDCQGTDCTKSSTVCGLRKTFGIPETDSLRHAHLMLSRTAVKIASERHCGHLSPLFSGNGLIKVQIGKDLTKIPVLIAAGGPLVFSSDLSFVLEGALRGEENENNLMPEAPEFYKDSNYILYAAGLLSSDDPKAALHIMKKYIKKLN